MFKLHHYIMAILVGIFTTVSYLMYTSLVEDLYPRSSTYHWTLKAILIIAPAVVFLFISFPSLILFYVMDEVMNPSITLKAIGNQWHSTYKYGDYTDMEVEFNFYMTLISELKTGNYRLREVDNKATLPVNSNVKVLIISNEVIHCWAVPSLGVKVHLLPGRFNQTVFIAKRPSLFTGACSEVRTLSKKSLLDG